MRFAFSKRLGATSSASILLETSIAKTISTPSRFTVSILVPILGLAKAMLSSINTTAKTLHFPHSLKRDRSGAKRLRVDEEANCFCNRRLRSIESTKIMNSGMSTAMSQRYIFSSM